jgi:hypothetical protein
MQAGTYVSPFYFNELAQAVSGPYTALDAYQAGTIDANGNIIKPESSIDSFEYLVIKLKNIFDELPYGTTKAKLQSYLTTLQLFTEEVKKFNITEEQFNFFVEGIIAEKTNAEVSYIELLEDMAVGGGGGGAGTLGTPGAVQSTGGVMGMDPVMGKMAKRNKLPFLKDCEIFDVCPEEYSSFALSKSWNTVPDSETKNYLKRFQQRNPNSKMAVRSFMPETKKHEIFWINYSPKTFMEEFNLNSKYFNLE